MKAFIDNTLLDTLVSKNQENYPRVIEEACQQANLLFEKDQVQLIYYWPTLLQLLKLDSIFDNFFELKEQHPLFDAINTTINTEFDVDVLIRLYDQLFVECLTHVKNIPEIDAQFLVEKIKEIRIRAVPSDLQELISPLLDYYEKYLTFNTAHAMHNLVLFLAWDRMCVNTAILFEHDSASNTIRPGLNILKVCLLESFQHITTQNKTAPSFFRLLEALYADEMRQENLDIPTEQGWLALCQGARLLKPRNKLANVFFIDEALTTTSVIKDSPEDTQLLKILTVEPFETLQAGITVCKYLNERISLLMPEWPYLLRPIEAICFINDEDLQLICVKYLFF